MNYYLVERRMPGMTQASLVALQRALGAATHRLGTPGSPVRYIGSVYLPQRDTCLCLFEATDPGRVRRANDTAQAPYDQIHEAVALLG